MKPYHAVDETLRTVGRVLEEWCTPILKGAIASDQYLLVVKRNVFPDSSSEAVPTHDASFWLKVFTSGHYWNGLLQHKTDSSQKRRAQALLTVRNEAYHHQRTDLDWALRALQTAREFLRLLDYETEADEVRTLADIISATSTVTTPDDSDGYDYEAALQEAETLNGRLLVLDPDQRAFVQRFAEPSPVGPWLLKGGPGSGKTVVALHSIKQLLGGDQQTLAGVAEPMRVLFTTYTNSLANTSHGLLKELLTDEQLSQVTVATIDALARKLAEDSLGKGIKSLRPDDLHNVVFRLLKDDQGPRYGEYFDTRDVLFLVDEFDQGIAGRGITSLDEYLGTPRPGRERPLNSDQRQVVWQLYLDSKGEKRSRWLRGREGLMFSEILAVANDAAKPTYDYVFVDEAQDLKSVALSLAVSLAISPSRVFVGMDANQSIFGKAMPWKMVSDQLDFRGRAFKLAKNHRTTREIWAASLEVAAREDEESLAIEAINNGMKPTLAWAGPESNQTNFLNEAIQQALVEDGITPASVAVLCPTEDIVKSIADGLDAELKPRATKASDFDMSHDGVKVTTIHAAKGMGFPFVVVAGVGGGTLPPAWALPGVDGEHYETQKRLIFVACTRAMNRLLVLASKEERSPLLDAVTPANWEIVEV